MDTYCPTIPLAYKPCIERMPLADAKRIVDAYNEWAARFRAEQVNCVRTGLSQPVEKSRDGEIVMPSYHGKSILVWRDDTVTPSRIALIRIKRWSWWNYKFHRGGQPIKLDHLLWAGWTT